MRLRDRFWAALFIFCMVFCSILSGCGVSDELSEFILELQDKVETGKGEVENEPLLSENENGKVEILAEEKINYEVTAEDDYQEILDACTGEFIGYRMIDEAFLTWFSAAYGHNAVKKIVQEVAKSDPDPEIWYDLTGNTIRTLWLLYCKQNGYQQEQLDDVIWQDCASTEETTLAFIGDINFSEGYVTTRHMDQCKNGIYDCFSEDLLALMNRMDIMMVNNEFTYSRRGEALEGKAYTFRADPERAELLRAFGTDIVGLANNHVYDFGPDALCDTIDTLEELGFPHVGAGKNLKEASKPCYFICNGRKIAIVAATQIERSLNYTKEATEDSPGVLKTLNPDKFVQVIENEEKNSDIVIAVVHWGTEGDSHYGRDQYELAKAFAEAGADAIIGGHTHCLQGFEIVEDVPVLYSLGNFWFSSGTLDTGIAKLTIDKKGELTLGFIPCIQKNIKTQLITDEAEQRRIFEFLEAHSAKGVTLTEEGILQKVQ